MSDDELMRVAIAACKAGIAAGQSPFGAVLARDGMVLVASHNTVWRDVDPTAHAEVNVIRAGARTLGQIDLSGSTLYSTCEPCPMCLAASHWARIDRVVFGASIADATAAGFSELNVAAAQLAALGGSPLRIEGGLLPRECADLFRYWRESGQYRPY
jgi:tRNA(Arg) A34 adenosine deaminase TadA